ncbi:MAG: Maf family protein [Planctomycetota bacterium]
MTERRLVLGSRSPRRAGLLAEAGFAFRQVDPPYADPADPSTHSHAFAGVEALAERLAVRKAESLAGLLAADELGVTADTVCVDGGGRAIGTPESAGQAEAMIRGFVNSAHRVVTGVALVSADGAVVERFADAATVALGALSDREITEYVAGDRWRGKAGGYNLTERVAAGWPIEVDGDPDTVVGLPVGRLVGLLERHGVARSGQPAA